jgi:hypothetical protein
MQNQIYHIQSILRGPYNRRRSRTPIRDEMALYCFAAVAMAVPAIAAIVILL